MNKSVLLLAVFSGLSMNLILQLGLGLRTIVSDTKRTLRSEVAQWFFLFIDVIVVWALYAWLLAPFGLSFTMIFLLFPLNAVLLYAAGRIIRRFFRRRKNVRGLFDPLVIYSALATAASYFTLNAADGLTDAVILALGFTLGAIITITLLRPVGKRLQIEKTPTAFAGIPLMLLSVGLFSFITSELAVNLLNH
jgi:Na+-translocating ferredoxin:NAD+ oxidoreductase RnfA subunit